MKIRRLLTVPLFLIATAVITIALPLLLVVALTIGTHSSYRGAVPTLLFIAGYFWCETIGIVSSLYIWLRHRNQSAFIDANYRLQFWWANALKVIAEQLFKLKFEITGQDALDGSGAIMFPRHTSIADTVIPLVFYAKPAGIRLRYVLKNELLIDPCLDIVGNRLPNLFVDRGGQDSERARRSVANLVSGLADREGILIYPEGTRFSAAKRAAIAKRNPENRFVQEQLSRWQRLLPPRLGGTLALLSNNPGRDILFCAHVGFEGSSHFGTLINGSWIGAIVRIHFWRVPFSAIPPDQEGAQNFLFAEWDRMEALVGALAEGRPASSIGS